MDFYQAQQDTLQWLIDFVGQPHPALAGNIQHALFRDWPDQSDDHAS